MVAAAPQAQARASKWHPEAHQAKRMSPDEEDAHVRVAHAPQANPRPCFRSSLSLTLPCDAQARRVGSDDVR